MSIAPNTPIGPYAVVREIGRGGMGVVFLGRDTRLDRDVAIKALPEELKADPVRLARFEREAKLLAQLNHSNVAGIHGIEEQDGQKYLILEYVAGETLADRLERGPIPVQDALEIAIGIASGIEAAHEAGVVHRDLKPANVRISPDGTVKVLDFGLAKPSEAASSSVILTDSPTVTARHSPTIPGVILGTVGYMSPEQARGRHIDKRTDVWSFGVVLYEMLTGIAPFVGETASDSIGAILHKDVDFKRLPPGTPHVVRHVLERCLVRDKAQRYRDIGDVRIELERALSGPASEAWIERGARRLPLLALAGIAIVVALASAVITRFASPAAPEPRTVRLSLPLPWEIERLSALDFAPDGTMLAFAVLEPESSPRTWSVYLRHLDRTAFDKLHSSTRAPQLLSFTPDSAELILAEGDEAEREYLSRVPLDRGRPVPLLEADAESYSFDDGAWLSDEEFLVFGEKGDLKRTMYAISRRDGSSREVFTVPEKLGQWFFNPFAAPGGRCVFFSAGGLQDGEVFNNIYAWAPASGETHRVLENALGGRFVDPGILAFAIHGEIYVTRFDPHACQCQGQVQPVRDEMGGWGSISNKGHIAYARRRGSLPSMATIDRKGHIEALPGAQRWYEFDPKLSPDEAQIAVVYSEQRDGDRSTVAVVDIATGREQRIANGLVFPIGWLNDGRLAYIRVPGDASLKDDVVELDIMTWALAAAPAESLLVSVKSSDPFPDVSPDGRYVVYSAPATKEDKEDKDKTVLMLRDLTDPASGAQEFVGSGGSVALPAFSPDGRWLAYASKVAGKGQVFLIPFAPGEAPRPIRVSVGDGWDPFWSRDSSELFYHATAENGPGEVVMGATLATDPALHVSTPAKILDGDRYNESNLAPMADGERFIFYDRPERKPEDDHLTVVLNWAAELRRQLEEK